MVSDPRTLRPTESKPSFLEGPNDSGGNEKHIQFEALQVIM